MPNSASRSWFLNAYTQLILGGVLNSAGEILLKIGANASHGTTLFGVTALASYWTWLGIAGYILGLLCWLYVLKTMPLNIAFAVLNALRLLIPLGAFFILSEPVSLRRWIGISIAFLGVFLILKPLVWAEEMLLSAIAICLCLVCQLCSVSGQLFFKHAMNPKKPQGARKFATLMIVGIATQALWFFLWVGLLQKWELSRLFPFEGLAPALMALAAWVVLKEKLPAIAWAGLLLICLGIGIVSYS